MKRKNASDTAFALLRCILYLCVFLFVPSVVSFLVSVVVSMLKSNMPTDVAEELLTKLTSPIMALSYVVIILIFTVYFKVKKTSLLSEAGVMPVKVRVAVDGALLGIGMFGIFQMLITVLVKIIPQSWQNLQDNQAISLLGGELVIGVLYTVVVAPICEEIVFRGLLLGTLEGHVPKFVGVIVVAIVFSIIHLPSPIAIIYTFVLGIILGFVRYRTKSLVPCILAHVAFNAINYLLFIDVIMYIILIASIPLVIYSVIDIVRKTRG